MTGIAERQLVHLLRTAAPLTASPSSVASVGEPWADIVAAARRHDLSPALAHAIASRDLTEQLTPETRDDLRRDVSAIAIGNYWRLRELGALLDLFARDDLAVVLLKGAALAPTLYRGRAERRIGDLDVLIRAADFDRVRHCLGARGYGLFTEEKAAGFQLRHENAQAFWRDDEHGSQVDVHWHVIAVPAFRDRVDIDWFWQRTSTVAMGAQDARVLDRDAQLMHLALHFALHHQCSGLKWSYDLALLLASSARVDWPALLRLADDTGLQDAFRMALDVTAETWGTSIPPEATAPRRSRGRRVRDQIRLAAATAPARGLEVVFQCAGPATLGAKTRYLAANFFPSPAYMRKRYRVPHDAFLPVFYVWRAGVGVGKLTRSAASAVARFVHLRSTLRDA